MKFQSLTELVVSLMFFSAAAGAQPSGQVAPHLDRFLQPASSGVRSGRAGHRGCFRRDGNPRELG